MEDDASGSGQRFILESASLEVSEVTDHAAVATIVGNPGPAWTTEPSCIEVRAPTVMVP